MLNPLLLLAAEINVIYEFHHLFRTYLLNLLSARHFAEDSVTMINSIQICLGSSFKGSEFEDIFII